MADSCFITNRRNLLIGMSAVALLPIPAVRPEPVEGLSPNGIVQDDPALLAYGRVMEIERALLDIPADEEDPYYLSMVRTLEQAENQFAKSCAVSPNGIRAKLHRMAYICAWEPEWAIRDCPLVGSIVSDFAFMMNG